MVQEIFLFDPSDTFVWTVLVGFWMLFTIEQIIDYYFESGIFHPIFWSRVLVVSF